MEVLVPNLILNQDLDILVMFLYDMFKKLDQLSDLIRPSNLKVMY